MSATVANELMRSIGSGEFGGFPGFQVDQTGIDGSLAGRFYAQPVNVGPPGYAMPIHWAPAAGATDVEITQATLTVSPAVVTTNTQLPVTTTATNADIAVPSGVTLGSVTLTGLAWVQDQSDSTKNVALNSDSDLSGNAASVNPSGGSLYLLMSIKDATGKWTPFATAPALSGVGVLPPALHPLSLATGVIKLPPFAGGGCRFQLVAGNAPANFALQNIAIAATVSVQTIATPIGLTLSGPDSATIWSFAGALPAGAAPLNLDISSALKRTLKANLPAASPPVPTFTLQATNTATATIIGPHVAGAYLRKTPGGIVATLLGDPAPLLAGSKSTDPPAFMQPLASETPASATCALRIKYAGIRILPAVNDALPAGQPPVGQVVESIPVVRVLPPQCLGGLAIARIGLIGSAPIACSLTVQLVDMTSGAPGAPVSKPGTITLASGIDFNTVWVTMPAGLAPTVPIAVSVTAPQGRFFWASANQQPLTRIAVFDPSPGGRPIQIGGATLMSVTSPDYTSALATPPADVFAGSPPVLTSELFATVTMTDLTLRYAR